MKDQILALRQEGLSFGQIGKRLGITRNAVAGALYRAAHPTYRTERNWRRGFRDPELVANCVALADAIGLSAASRCLQISAPQLCRWRKRFRAMEAAQ